MAISMTGKQEVIQQLLVTKTKSYQTEIKLLLKLKPDEAEEVKTHGKELSRKIDALIADSMSEWLGDSEVIVEDVRSINRKFQRSIHEIQNDVDITKNVVNIVGFIDEVVDIVVALA